MGISRLGFIVGLIWFMAMDWQVLCMAQSNVHHYNFVLQQAQFTRLCETKTMLTVNGSFPGPTIHARRGDTIYVNVHNEGEYGVTIHWHGVKQPRNPWSDGPENVTQCPIQPGKNFTYEVILSDEEGTLWWHAHSDWTRATVHGAIVISPANGTTYPFPAPYAEQTIIIGSWFKGDVKAVIDEALATGGTPNISNSLTINGQPGDLYPCSEENTYRLNVNSGRTYLLRVINAVMNEEQFFGIAGHSLTVVGQDAAYIKPITTNYIMITPGQTMDILVTANQPPSYYYIASHSFADGPLAPYDKTTTTAIFQYNGNYSRPSSIPLPVLPIFNDTAAADNYTSRVRGLASSDHPVNVPQTVNRSLYITVSLNFLPCTEATCSDSTRFAASMNNVSFQFQPIDILQAYYRSINGVFDADFPSEPLKYFNFTGNVTGINVATGRATKVTMLNYGEAVEIVFQGTNLLDAVNHPIHLHGFSFYLVGHGKGNFNNETDPKSYNLIDPPEINTVALPRSGWAAIRFVANNPGVWFIHCHLERHSSWGMDTVLIVRNGRTRSQSMRPPPASLPSCS
ncbi:laccase-14-like [Populus alba x Populus x berolinensis]|uniref:Laccase n=1 Tax=Populus alba x Populus x berolinensis TaxID=444605 RepID=A0AAD6PPJ0_9ROSI|nr:laccase-14-like [Populus alba x Populus x berolinensis]